MASFLSVGFLRCFTYVFIRFNENESIYFFITILIFNIKDKI